MIAIMIFNIEIINAKFINANILDNLILKKSGSEVKD